MKYRSKKIFILITLILIMILIPLSINLIMFKPTKINAFIASKIYKEPANISFTDDIFYQCVVDAYNMKNNTKLPYTTNLTDEQLKTITYLDCSGVKENEEEKINNTIGLEKLINLQTIHLDYNNISEINISNNKNISLLSLSNNKLSNLDISNNDELKNLFLSDNNFTTFEASSSLTTLDISYNNLTNISINKATNLIELNVSANPLTELDLSNNINLFVLYAYNNKLTNLDLTKNRNLEELDIFNFSNLDLKNQISELDLSYNNNLIYLNAFEIGLEKIKFNKNDKILKLWISNNNISTIDLSSLKSLEILNIMDNKIENLDVSKNLNLKELNLTANNIKIIDLSQNTKLNKLNLSKNNIINIDLSKNTELRYLDLFDNDIKTIDLSKNTKLYSLNLYNNDISKKLDLSSNVNLKDLCLTNIHFEKNIFVYKGQRFDFSKDYGVLKLPQGHLSKFVSLNREENNVIGTTISVDSLTTLSYVKFSHDFSQNNNTYDVSYLIYAIELDSDNYAINNEKEYIYVGNNLKNMKLNDFSIVSINKNYKLPEDDGLGLSINDNKLSVLFENNLLKEFNIINIDFGELSVYDKFILINRDINYNEFINNITTNGVTYKIYNDEKEVVNGNISNGMVLKVYKNDLEIDEFEITAEYLEFSEQLNVDETDMTINKLKEKTTVEDILSNINTSGKVTFENSKGNEITDKSIIGTGSKVIIELSNKTIEYILVISGDVTGDGIVNIADVVKIADHTLVGNILKNYEEKAAEVTNNNTLNIADVVKIADYTLNKNIEIYK